MHRYMPRRCCDARRARGSSGVGPGMRSRSASGSRSFRAVQNSSVRGRVEPHVAPAEVARKCGHIPRAHEEPGTQLRCPADPEPAAVVVAGVVQDGLALWGPRNAGWLPRGEVHVGVRHPPGGHGGALHPSKWAAAVRFDVFECRVVRRATDVCTQSDGFGRVVVGGVDEHLSEWVVPLLQSVDDPFEVVRFVGIGHDGGRMAQDRCGPVGVPLPDGVCSSGPWHLCSLGSAGEYWTGFGVRSAPFFGEALVLECPPPPQKKTKL